MATTTTTYTEANVAAPITTTTTILEDRPALAQDKNLQRQLENMEIKDEKLSDDEIIKLRVKGALESLKTKVVEG